MNLIGILDDDIEFRQNEIVKAIASLRTDVKPICHDNAPDLMEWLAGALTSIRLLSLDHDLGPSRERNGERFEPGTGMEIVDFLVLKRPMFPIIVHSSNPIDGPTMVVALRKLAGQCSGWFPSWMTGFRPCGSRRCRKRSMLSNRSFVLAPVAAGQATLRSPHP